MTTQPESKLSRAIMSALRARGIFCFKIHGGPTMMAGLTDIVACVPVWTANAPSAPRTRLGLFIGFETKMPGGVVSPIQEHRHAEIRAASGLVCVPHSVAEALAFLDWVQAGCPANQDPRD
jgi:hypothetical protein